MTAGNMQSLDGLSWGNKFSDIQEVTGFMFQGFVWVQQKKKMVKSARV